jgi:hypothetical protein
MASEGHYYYWDESFRNRNGETLQQCLTSYGVGVQRLPNLGRDIWMAVIFLSAKRKFGYSWCLRCYRRPSGANIPVQLYENKNARVYGPLPQPHASQ